ncbi:MAG: CBS domain-containing protein, partial [Nitrospirae bacterium]
RVGALFVDKGGALVGIVTDTDVVRRAVAGGEDLGKLAVHTIMTSPIVTIESMRTVQDAHDMMGDLGVRHLGVTEQGRLVGLVSVRDLLVYFKRVSEPKITQD